MENRNENEELKQMAPTFFGLEKKPPFEAPEGYFESFPMQLQKHLQKPERRYNPLLSFLLRWKYALSFGCVALIAGMILLSRPAEIPTKNIEVAVHSENMVDEVLDTYNEDELIAVLSEIEEEDLISEENNEVEEYILDNYSTEEIMNE